MIFDFLKKRHCEVLIALRFYDEGITISRLCDNLDICYSSIGPRMEYWERYGIIDRKRVGKKKIITITEKGKELSNRLSRIYALDDEKYYETIDEREN